MELNGIRGSGTAHLWTELGDRPWRPIKRRASRQRQRQVS